MIFVGEITLSIKTEVYNNQNLYLPFFFKLLSIKVLRENKPVSSDELINDPIILFYLC